MNKSLKYMYINLDFLIRNLKIKKLFENFPTIFFNYLMQDSYMNFGKFYFFG